MPNDVVQTEVLSAAIISYVLMLVLALESVMLYTIHITPRAIVEVCMPFCTQN